VKKELKQKWIKMLRSGRYKQGRGHLAKQKTENSDWRFCCLGVLCEAAGTKAKFITDDKTRYQDDFKVARYGDSDATLNENLRRKYGITLDETEKLMELNDNEKWSFKRIATWIEKNL